MNHILNYQNNALQEYFLNNGYKKFLANQVFDWIYQKRQYDLNNWHNISNEVKKFIKDNLSFEFITIQKKQTDKLTAKYLFKLVDDNYVEAVLMHHDYGLSVCISSQVGCNMGCKFCESGRLKKVRNLETYEMVEQILLIEQDIKKRIDSIVIMGIGEPFDNYDNVMNFIRIVNDPKGISIGARHITVSTCGLVPKIKQFMEEDLQVNLAISLHAPNNEIRNMIMPVNQAYSIDILIDTLKTYIARTNRRVTLEYVMLYNINDSIDCANELADLIRGMNVYVNLIPYNETSHIEFRKSPNIDAFYDQLKKRGINVTVRREFGSKIDAACGQLRSKEVDK
ncbi:MAG: 23S rRNA (adenine(2503)-C(2))-methyltransferase RlmN [Bacilli bacterium]|nr:23S rRNA (adenine(2503)-C(2))-methyltransferase RlmN [Bacilli bacterium]